MPVIGSPAPPRVPSQWDFTAPFEGVVPHLYLDTRGNVTCGVGFLVPSDQSLGRYPWHPGLSTAVADWHVLKQMDAGKGPLYYRRQMCARLFEPDMRNIFNERVDDYRRLIDPLWRLQTLPQVVQVALVDMAFNLGATGLSKYTRMLEALRARDFAQAARECWRTGVPAARNDATSKLIAMAVGLGHA